MHDTVSHPNTETSTQQYTEHMYIIQPATHSVHNTYIPIQHTTIPYIHTYISQSLSTISMYMIMYPQYVHNITSHDAPMTVKIKCRFS